jgi:hypothetical protein
MARAMLGSTAMWLLLGLGSTTLAAQAWLSDARLAAFGGPVFLSNAASRPMELGMSADAILLHPGHGVAGAGVLAEGGLFHPALSGKGNYYFSSDAMLCRDLRSEDARGVTLDLRVRPFAVAGYTRFFNATSSALNAANALNFGVGVDRALTQDLSLRLELREQYTPSSDSHALVLRIGIVALGSLQ